MLLVESPYRTPLSLEGHKQHDDVVTRSALPGGLRQEVESQHSQWLSDTDADQFKAAEQEILSLLKGN